MRVMPHFRPTKPTDIVYSSYIRTDSVGRRFSQNAHGALAPKKTPPGFYDRWVFFLSLSVESTDNPLVQKPAIKSSEPVSSPAL
jgi:hypothetical protein